MQLPESSAPDSTAPADEAPGFRTRLGAPSPWTYIAVVGPLYFLVGGLVQAVHLPLGLLWNQSFLFVWLSGLWLWAAGFRPSAFTRADRAPRLPWLVLAISVTAFFCASAMMGVLEALAPQDWVRAFDETQVLTSVSGPWTAVLFAGVIVGAPIAEEVVFRGCLLPMLAERMRLGWALVIQAALFSLIHGDPIGFLPRFVLGLAFGMLWIFSGSLWAGVFAHALNNGISAIVFFWIGTENGEMAVSDLWIGVSVSIAAGAFLALFLWLLRRKAQPRLLPSQDAAAVGLPIARGSLLGALRLYATVALLGLGAVALAGHFSR